MNVGGFLPLEPASPQGGGALHDAPAFATARGAIRWLLEGLCPRRVYLPDYLCEAVPRAAEAAGVPATRYTVGLDLRPRLPAPGPGELLVVVNYFGVLDAEVAAAAAAWPGRVLVDDSQAYLRAGDPAVWSVNSVRKFLGVPDGAYLYGPLPGVPDLDPWEPTTGYLEARAASDPGAYAAYRAHEASLDGEPRAMSAFTRARVARVDHRELAARRAANFAALHRRLAATNQLALPDAAAGPLYYPYLGPPGLRRRLLARRLWVPHLWPEVAGLPGPAHASARDLAARLCPLPVDQRYDEAAMARVAEAVLDAAWRG